MPKKLSDLKKDELVQLAEGFAVDLEEHGAKTKAQIIKALNDEAITDDVLASTEEHAGEPEASESTEPEPKKAPVSREDTVVVFMQKANPTYELFGHKFTKAHPYVAMSADDAQEIFDFEPRGFRVATPAEVKEYYS